MFEEQIFKVLEDLGITNAKEIERWEKKCITFNHSGEKIIITYNKIDCKDSDVWKDYFYSLDVDGHNRGIGCPKQEPYTDDELIDLIGGFLNIKKKPRQMTLFDFM